MGRLLKGGLALGGTVLTLGALRRALNPSPRYAPWEKPRYDEFENKVLVVGGGFGGFTAAKEICQRIRDREDVGVLVVAKDNFFTFWPMVAGIVSSDIDSRNVAQPLRRALITAGASFRRATLREIDHENKTATVDGGVKFSYDHLVLALGGQPNFFGIPGVEEHALTMRGIEDAEQVRNRVIERFEEVSLMRGEIPESKLTFVVIGGGATGVETASELYNLVHEALEPDYPNIDPYRVRIFLLEALDHILPELDPALRKAARTRLQNQRIEVRTGAMAEEITDDCVRLKGGVNIPTENVIWTAGDCAAVPNIREEEHGQVVPPNAQAAVQEGKAVAKNVLATIDGREDQMEPFEYRPLGQLVELGSDFAVNEVMGVRFTGTLAAVFWRLAYLTRLDSPQSKAHQMTDWVLGMFLRPAVTQVRGTSEE